MVAWFRSWWQTIRKPLAVVGIIVACVLGIVTIVGIIGGYLFSWNWTGLSRKTLWDWLQLLIIPLALAIIAILFNRAERKNEQRIASDNQQEGALQEYIKEMSELLLERNLRNSDEDAEVRTIARVRTLTVLPRLDKNRKRSVLQFLHEAGLIRVDKPIVLLLEADLSKANLSRANLFYVDLTRANLREAILDGTILDGAVLDSANLSGANLRRALIGADLSGANLNGAILEEANLVGAKVTTEQLDKAKSLKGATMPDGSKHP